MFRKIKSFTLSEITVTLIIVLIVIMIAYQILRNIQTNFSTFQKNENTSGIIMKNYYYIKKDFDKSKTIIKDNNQLFLITKKQDTIIYTILDEILVRKVNICLDTIDCSIKEYEYHSAFKNDNLKLVKSIKLSFTKNSEDDIFVLKEYSTEELFRIKEQLNR